MLPLKCCNRADGTLLSSTVHVGNLPVINPIQVSIISRSPNPCEHRPSLLTHQRPPNSELSKADIPLSTTHLLKAAQLTAPQRPELDLSHGYSLYDGQQVELLHCNRNHSRHSDTTDLSKRRPASSASARRLLQRYEGPITAARCAGRLDVALLF